MISAESRTLKWIKDAAKKNGATHITLVEKTIRAFSLLEALARSGCPFRFKGGTSLMLHLNSSKRMSIDVDIVCPPGTDIESYLDKYANEYGFSGHSLVERKSRNDVPKTHAKMYYQVSYKTNTDTDKILLDVLNEDNNYSEIVSLPIKSPFLVTEGEDVQVSLPSKADLLGDKLTAFAPNTTGIPYFKGEKECFLEIVKQMFDIASLFDVVDDLTNTINAYRKIATVELAYREKSYIPLQKVAEDTIETAMAIALDGMFKEDDYKMLTAGVSRIKNYVHSEKYNMLSAHRDAAKTAYAAACAIAGVTHPDKFTTDKFFAIKDKNIGESLHGRLNLLKKHSPEEFYYWYKTYELMSTI